MSKQQERGTCLALLLLLTCCSLLSTSVALPADDTTNDGASHSRQQQAEQQQVVYGQQQQQQQQQAGGVTAGQVEGRKTYNKNTNSIKMSGLDKKQTLTSEDISPASILTRLDWRSLFTTAMKMFFGNGDESSKQASKQLVQMVITLIDGLRLSFTMRKAQARSSGEEGTPTADAALAALSMLKTYVKTITSKSNQCAKKYLCQGNREAVRDGNKIGYIIAQAISYANSYVLENIQATSFEDNFNAGKEGRNGANCEEVFNNCNEI